MDEDLVPQLVRVESVRQESPEVRTLRLGFEDPEVRETFTFKAGQFCLASIMGEGEAAFCIASPPAWKDCFEISVKEAGKVTRAIHDLEPGERIGVRGPYGNWFPYEANFGRDIVFVGGGIGLAPLRPLILQTLEDRARFGDVSIICGARTADDLIYRDELAQWEKRQDIRFVKTVDPGGESASWSGEVGLVPEILEKVNPSADSVLVTCGPPVMIKFVFASASRLGLKPSDVLTTLEMKMACGVGTCGRCNIGHRYVCQDGPVFTLEDLGKLPDEF